MSKILLSEKEIQQLLQARVNLIHEIADDKAEVKVPLPYKREVDENGTNWDVYSIRNGNGYMAQIAVVIANLQCEVNLK